MKLTPAPWTLRLPPPVDNEDDLRRLRRSIDDVAARSQYGWGHTIDFGAFTVPGLLKSSWLGIAGGFDALGWWPSRLDGLNVADVGCFSGGLSLLLAQRGASVVHAIDEIPEHVEQCRIVADAFGMPQVKPVLAPLWRLEGVIPARSLDLVVLSSVLYHLSDMLVGLYILRQLVKPGGTLLIESNAVDDERSYANFGRFYAGMWWQPSGACIRDMCEFMGYGNAEVVFYESDRCLARAVAEDREIDYRRGLNYRFEELRDRKVRSLDPRAMAPALREADAR